MKKNIVKVGGIIMALTTTITMNACSQINNEIANDVCMALSEKYNESFVAVEIGDRFNTNSAKLYLHPYSDENMLFVARINRDTGAVEDNYIEEKVNYQVETVIKDSFLEEGIIVSSRCLIVTQDPLEIENDDYTPKSLKTKYDFDHYTIYLVVKNGDFTSTDIINAIKKSNLSLGVKLVIAGYIFESDTYSICSEKIQTYPDIGITMIEDESPIAAFDINVESGKCSILETELAEKIGKRI